MRLNISLTAISIFCKHLGLWSEIYFSRVPRQVGSYLGGNWLWPHHWSHTARCSCAECVGKEHSAVFCHLPHRLTPTLFYSLSKSSHLSQPYWFFGFAVLNLGLLLLGYLESDVLLQFWLHSSNRFIGGELTFWWHWVLFMNIDCFSIGLFNVFQ